MSYRILCYGDSNTWGYVPQWTDPGIHSERYTRDRRWTGILARLLGERYEIIEEGLTGRTTIYTAPGEEHRNGLNYLLPCLLSHRPLDMVIIMLGTNDLHIPTQPTVDHLGDGISRLVELIQATPKCGRNCKVPKIMVVSPTHIRAARGRGEVYLRYGCENGRALSMQFAPVYSQIATEKGCYFFDAALCAQPDEADGVHWSAESHQMFAQALKDEILSCSLTN